MRDFWSWTMRTRRRWTMSPRWRRGQFYFGDVNGELVFLISGKCIVLKVKILKEQSSEQV